MQLGRCRINSAQTRFLTPVVDFSKDSDLWKLESHNIWQLQVFAQWCHQWTSLPSQKARNSKCNKEVNSKTNDIDDIHRAVYRAAKTKLPKLETPSLCSNVLSWGKNTETNSLVYLLSSLLLTSGGVDLTNGLSDSEQIKIQSSCPNFPACFTSKKEEGSRWRSRWLENVGHSTDAQFCSLS